MRPVVANHPSDPVPGPSTEDRSAGSPLVPGAGSNAAAVIPVELLDCDVPIGPANLAMRAGEAAAEAVRAELPTSPIR